MSDGDRWINFGLWSATGVQKVSDLLGSFGVRFYVQEYQETEEVLRAWYAWDDASDRPNVGFQLWIHDDDMDTVGDKIVTMFPERTFGG
jgi:hypothetical protein